MNLLFSLSLYQKITVPTSPVMSALLCLPIPLLHLSHSLTPVPDKSVCADAAPHLTYDASVLILGHALPVLLVFFLCVGLIVR